MLRPLINTVVFEKAVAADGVEVFNLPVNPLSVVNIAIECLYDNAGTPVTGPARYLEVVDSLDRVSINYRGGSIVNARGKDIAALNFFRHGILPMMSNADDTDNEKMCVVLPVLLGRFAYDPDECFPATRAGELTMELQIDVADTGYDTFRYSIHSVELLGATPKFYERKSVVSKTWAATGDQNFDMPLGNTFRGALLFGTSDFTGAAPAPSWGNVTPMLNNETLWANAQPFSVLQQMYALLGRQPPVLDKHTHRVDATAASAIQETGGPIEQGAAWDQYAWLDWDPTRDDLYSIETDKASSFWLRSSAATADAVRCLPVERIAVSNAG